MNCNECNQPLQPWEVATCEPCLLAEDNSPKSKNSLAFTLDTNGNRDDTTPTGRKGRTGKRNEWQGAER